MEPLRGDAEKHKEKATLWSGQLISALHFIHKSNIIHKFIHIGYDYLWRFWMRNSNQSLLVLISILSTKIRRRVGFINNRIKLSTHHKSELVKKPIIEAKEEEQEYLTICNGEFGYYAPEIVRTMRISYKYDIWSLGWTLYYIATFNDMQLALQELGNFDCFSVEDLPFPEFFQETKLIKTIQSMLNVDENKRPSTADLIAVEKLSGRSSSHLWAIVFIPF